MAVVLPATASDVVTRALVDHFQRDFPLVGRPFAEIGAQLGTGEDEVIARLRDLLACGAVSRVGAVVRPHTAGASTLAAVAAPPERIEAVAAVINRFNGVNHNYERENLWNLWFVVTGRDWDDVQATLDSVQATTGLEVLNLPLEKSYHIDLGFSLFGMSGRRPAVPAVTHGKADETDRCLLGALEPGLEMTTRPFEALARTCGLSEAEVIERLESMIARGVISRFGIVVRHRAFGYTANAMAVWDVMDAEVDHVAETFSAEAGVTLCYRRPRRLPQWRYNLFTMIHGTNRPEVEATIRHLAELAGAHCAARDILFSTRCFKQRGAVFSKRGSGEVA